MSRSPTLTLTLPTLCHRTLSSSPIPQWTWRSRILKLCHLQFMQSSSHSNQRGERTTERRAVRGLVRFTFSTHSFLPFYDSYLLQHLCPKLSARQNLSFLLSTTTYSVVLGAPRPAVGRGRCNSLFCYAGSLRVVFMALDPVRLASSDECCTLRIGAGPTGAAETNK